MKFTSIIFSVPALFFFLGAFAFADDSKPRPSGFELMELTQKHASKTKDMEGFISPVSKKIPLAVQEAAKSAFVYVRVVKQEGVKDKFSFGSGFFLEGGKKFVTSRTNVTGLSPVDFKKESIAALEKIIKATESKEAYDLDSAFIKPLETAYPFVIAFPGEKANTMNVLHHCGDQKTAVTPELIARPEAVMVYNIKASKGKESASLLTNMMASDFVVFGFPESLLKGKEGKGIKIGKMPKTGDRIFVIGFPEETTDRLYDAPGAALMVSPGKVMSVDFGIIAHSADMNQGSGGSAIVNDQGELVGIQALSMQMEDERKLSFGPSIATFSGYSEMVEKLRATPKK